MLVKNYFSELKNSLFNTRYGGNLENNNESINKLMAENVNYLSMALSKESEKNKFITMLNGNFEIISNIFNYIKYMNTSSEFNKNINNKFNIIDRLLFFSSMFNAFSKENIDISKFNFIDNLYNIMYDIKNNKNNKYPNNNLYILKDLLTILYNKTKDKINLFTFLEKIRNKNYGINEIKINLDGIDNINELVYSTIHSISESSNLLLSRTNAFNKYKIDSIQTKVDGIISYNYIEEICLLEIIYFIFYTLDNFIKYLDNDYKLIYKKFLNNMFKSLENETMIYDLIFNYNIV